jgi:hypothetical protein
MVLLVSKKLDRLLTDSDVRKLVSFLKYNKHLTDLEAHIMGIFSVNNAIKRASKYGYEIKKKHSGVLWNRKTTYHMERNK